MKDASITISITLLLIGLGWFYSHPKFIYDDILCKVWHLWDKSLLLFLFFSLIFRQRNKYLKLSLIAISVFNLLRVVWQCLEFGNATLANSPEVIFILFLLDVFVIAWVIHIQFIVNSFKKWRN